MVLGQRGLLLSRQCPIFCPLSHFPKTMYSVFLGAGRPFCYFKPPNCYLLPVVPSPSSLVSFILIFLPPCSYPCIWNYFALQVGAHQPPCRNDAGYQARVPGTPLSQPLRIHILCKFTGSNPVWIERLMHAAN